MYNLVLALKATDIILRVIKNLISIPVYINISFVKKDVSYPVVKYLLRIKKREKSSTYSVAHAECHPT